MLPSKVMPCFFILDYFSVRAGFIPTIFIPHKSRVWQGQLLRDNLRVDSFPLERRVFTFWKYAEASLESSQPKQVWTTVLPYLWAAGSCGSGFICWSETLADPVFYVLTLNWCRVAAAVSELESRFVEWVTVRMSLVIVELNWHSCFCTMHCAHCRWASLILRDGKQKDKNIIL